MPKLFQYNGVRWITIANNGKDGSDGQNADPIEVARVVMSELKKDQKEEKKHLRTLVEDLLKQLLPKQSIPLYSKKRLGRGTGAPVQATDLSGSLDGSTTSFTIPTNSRVISVHSSSAPFTYRPTTDYTVSATTLTFTSEITAAISLAAGQTLTVIYVE